MGKKKHIHVGQVEKLRTIQPGTKPPIESSKAIPEERKSSAFRSDAELEKALNKFFGGPPFFLIYLIPLRVIPRLGRARERAKAAGAICHSHLDGCTF